MRVEKKIRKAVWKSWWVVGIDCFVMREEDI
jgi:hypothetical protein